MESSSIVERALKSSFRSKTEEGQYVAVEDCLLGHGGVSLVACNDDFVVDDWFDFSNEDGEVEEEEEGGGGGDEEDDGAEVPKDSSLSVSSQAGDDDCSNLSSSPSASSEPILTSELTVPDDDDIAELEWLSQFVDDDDSLPEFPTCYLPGKWEQESSAKNRSEPEPRSVLIRPLCFPSPVPVKTRTKRTRHAKKDQPPSSESSSTSSCSSENSSSSCLSFTSVLTSMEFVRSQSEPEKKKKMKKTREPPVQFQRRCSHCHVQKTPQWRGGPLGLKTLCNACGVRYKSGRLFPEYRPACSPTFSVEAHSNSHRKVLEMRKRKEMAGNGIEGGRLKLNRMVTSF